MRGILRLSFAHIRITLREKITLFWFLIFPLVLLVLLTLIFGGLGEGTRVTFDLALFRFAPAQAAGPDFAGIVEHVLTELGTADGDRPALFDLSMHPEPDPSALAEELERLRLGKLDVVVVIPELFNDGLLAPSTEDRPGTALEVYTSAGRTSSAMAYDILRQVLSSVDQEILAATGRFDRSAALQVGRREIGAETSAFSYVDFLLPGIVLMGLFTAGLFNVPGTILFAREQRILKRYWVTPFSTPAYLVSFGIGHLVLCGLQFGLIYAVARWALGASLSFLAAPAAAYLLLAVATFLAIGFLVASVARTGNAGMAIANILNMPMMFLGGLFFPIGDLPFALRLVMMANPLTYLADGLRASLGVDVAVFPATATVAVPAVWILVSGALAAWRLRWKEGA